mmetsp:Transcript_18945/g.21807  ORF Transcript_18945/g.21807 Transcript_18945/m.21807 type:complete len:662 (+) Transcript_18945:177-2162(+)
MMYSRHCALLLVLSCSLTITRAFQHGHGSLSFSTTRSRSFSTKLNQKKRISTAAGSSSSAISRTQQLNDLAKSQGLAVPALVDKLTMQYAKYQETKRNNPDISVGTVKKMRFIRQLIDEYETNTTNGSSSAPTSARASAAPSEETDQITTILRPKRIQSIQTRVDDLQTNQREAQTQARSDPTLLSDVTFASRPDLHPASKRAVIDVLGLETMTEIQSKTFEAAALGTDVLGRARTGTGKTLAFLLPAVESILRQVDDEKRVRGTSGCEILIISPTRELATQIGTQAAAVLKYHRGLSSLVVFGGTKINRDKALFAKGLPTILVATPGRLVDHLQNTKINESTLLQVMAVTDCVSDVDVSTHTHARVEQSHVVLPSMDRYVSSVLEIIDSVLTNDEPDVKLVVFFPTARMVGYYVEVLREYLKLKGDNTPTFEIHSKKTQGYRNKASDGFRNTKRGILFTSDVSARGVDYPEVTHVLQFGIPDGPETYVHRLGRTGRAGKKGKGWLILAPFERQFLRELKGHDVPLNSALTEILESPPDPELASNLERVLRKVQPNPNARENDGSPKGLSEESATWAYQAFLGYYLSNMKRLNGVSTKEQLVRYANEFAVQTGYDTTRNGPPGIEDRTLKKMGLKGIRGITVAPPRERSPRNANAPRNGRR